jgi:hypothetical protein
MPQVGKITIRVDKTGDKYELDMKVKKQDDSDADDVANGPNQDDVKAEATIEVKVTNPCTWIRIGGLWRRICW